MARQDFAREYGGFMELMYLIITRLPYDMEQVDKWNTERYLFWGQYLLRKKNLESIE